MIDYPDKCIEMEKLSDLEQRRLVDELTQGRELANQLKNHIGPIASKETCEHLLQKILSSYDKALESLNWTSLLQDPSAVVALVESPESCDNISPKRGRGMDQGARDVSKKRKIMPRWSEQVRVCSGTGLEGPLDDGYSWRKYGQKDILGAIHPRAYYRCTHRPTRGCLATKQVQRSDEDSSIVEVTYKGKHSCIRDSNSASPAVPVEHGNPKGIINSLQQQMKGKEKKEQGRPFNLGQGLKVETEAINTNMERFPSFSFPSTTNQPENSQWERLEDLIIGSYSQPFMSPATSESNYFSNSPCQMHPYGIESDLTDMLSTPNSVTDSPFSLDLPDVVSFDPNLALESLEYFS